MSDQPGYSSGQDPTVRPPQDQPPQEPRPAYQQQPESQSFDPRPPAQPLSGPQPDLPFPLQGGEQVIRVVRRHWWFLWPFTLWLVIVAVGPVIVLGALLDAIGILDNLGWFFWVPAILWMVFWGVRALFNWYRYQNDIWVITNQRIVDVFRSNPLNKRVTTADLVNIQDMSVHRRGFIATVLRFGTVVCTTAGGSTGVFEIAGIPQAEEVQLLIDRERDRERARRA